MHRPFPKTRLLLLGLSSWTMSGVAVRALSGAASTTRIIDSHLHVWANTKEAVTFPYAEGKEPPAALADKASTSALLEHMNASGVVGALIVQPINHKFDHSYVIQAIQSHPDRFKGMLLHDPSLNKQEAVARLEELALQGFVGVRFNPYLWPKTDGGGWIPMSTPGSAGLAVYKRCAQLNMPVGVMCFQGLDLHYRDIVALIKASPDTQLILDHFGFTGFADKGNATFQQLLDLAPNPNVMVKISALFRLEDPSPYERVRSERLMPLLEAFGADRLMFGTDFPFVLEQPEGYGGMVELVSSWLTNETERESVMGGTAEKAFGAWGAQAQSSQTTDEKTSGAPDVGSYYFEVP